MDHPEHDHELIGRIGCPRCQLDAAAPDLLAVCEAFVVAYEHIGHGCYPVDPHNPNNLLKVVRAAIAKARGE